jgi:hypothetical protein
VQKQMKVLWTLNMQVLVLGAFFVLSFFLLLSFEQVSTESKKGIYVPSFDAKERINLELCECDPCQR